MTSTTRSFAIAAGLILAGACLPIAGHAQDYPNKSITAIVPYPAGGPSDVVARIVTDQMGKVLGRTIVIENVVGCLVGRAIDRNRDKETAAAKSFRIKVAVVVREKPVSEFRPEAAGIVGAGRFAIGFVASHQPHVSKAC